VDNFLCVKYERLAEEILATKPQFPGYNNTKASESETQVADSSEDELNLFGKFQAYQRLVQEITESTASITVNSSPGSPNSSSSSAKSSDKDSKDEYECKPLEVGNIYLTIPADMTLVFHIRTVIRLVKQMSRREMHGYSENTDVMREIMAHCVARWEVLCFKYFEAAKHDLQTVMDKMCDYYFGNFKSHGLMKEIR